MSSYVPHEQGRVQSTAPRREQPDVIEQARGHVGDRNWYSTPVVTYQADAVEGAAGAGRITNGPSAEKVGRLLGRTEQAPSHCRRPLGAHREADRTVAAQHVDTQVIAVLHGEIGQPVRTGEEAAPRPRGQPRVGIAPRYVHADMAAQVVVPLNGEPVGHVFAGPAQGTGGPGRPDVLERKKTDAPHG